MNVSCLNPKVILSLLLFAISAPSYAQVIHAIQSGDHPDSSYYDIARIDDNEFWVGGENGILTCLDSLGNVSHIELPVRGRDILKIVPSGQYVYLAADQGPFFGITDLEISGFTQIFQSKDLGN